MKIDVSEMSQLDDPMEQYLESMRKMKSQMKGPDGLHYSSPEDFLLQNGKHYASDPLSEDEMQYIKDLAFETDRYQIKECFYNAQSLAQVSKRIKYVEGYLYSGMIPIEHAWNTLNGKIIDFTMYHQNNDKPILGVIPEKWDYYGVSLPTGSIREYWKKYKMSEPMISNWRSNYLLLKNKFEKEEEAPEAEVEDELV